MLDPDVIVDAAVAEEHGAQRIDEERRRLDRASAPFARTTCSPLADEVVLRPGPRVDEGVAMLARALHPGLALRDAVGLQFASWHVP